MPGEPSGTSQSQGPIPGALESTGIAALGSSVASYITRKTSGEDAMD